MSQPPSSTTDVPPVQAQRGIVKQLLSGDAVVIRGQPRGGPPPERTLALSNIMAPRLARRANPNVDGSSDTKDEPYAWECREFLRKLLIGKNIQFVVDYKVPASGREYGMIWITVDGQPKNVTDMLVCEGLVEVRQAGARASEELSRLVQLEEGAKASGKGKWSKDNEKKVVRDVTWNLPNEDLRNFVERNHGKELDAVIEHVRDGSTLRAMIVPQFLMMTVSMSGVKSPTFKRDEDKEVPEPYAEMARFFTESRLLQREVKLLLEGVSNQIVLATVIHPAGNIAELLLKEGFARCVDWSIAVVTKGKDKLRAAEKQAKEQQLRIWKGYQPSSKTVIPIKSKNFTGKVVEIVNADALVVKTTEGYQKIYFSSLRPPRLQPKEDEAPTTGHRVRALYDIPYVFEAREFMRKKLIGKKVNVTVDYIRPSQDTFPERTCCTVTREGINIADALISKGLGYCLRHRQDDDQRSSQYDDLMSSEARALKSGKGVHSKKEPPIHRVADLSGEPAKAKQFLPFLQRVGKTVALVEFVASGSRTRLYLAKDTCLITFLLAGISCPRMPRATDSQSIPGDPFGQEALTFTKELILQREVEVEVETVDKGGNFIGWLFIDGKNLSLSLVEEGLSKVIPQAERSSYGRALFAAEEKARSARKNIWEDYSEPQPEEDQVEEVTEDVGPIERKTNYQKVVVTEVLSCNHFWAQMVDQGPKLEQLMEQLRSTLVSSPPLAGAFTPKKGMLCVAKFTDGLWYRAKVERVVSASEIHVIFIDYGNRQVVSSVNTAAVPAGFSGLPPQATEYHLAFVIPPDDEDWQQESLTAFSSEVMDKPVLLNVEYKVLGQEYVTLQHVSDNSDIAEKLVTDGLLRVERKKDKRLAKLVSDYVKCEEEARKARTNIWRYGDFTPDDAREFGYQRK